MTEKKKVRNERDEKRGKYVEGKGRDRRRKV